MLLTLMMGLQTIAGGKGCRDDGAMQKIDL